MLIEVKAVTKAYRTPAGSFVALRDVDFAANKGEFVALVGKSGSGKSTLLNMLGGIDRPTEGSVVVDGTAIEAMGENALALWRGRKVGLVFQFFQLLPTLTVIENVMLPMDFSGSIPPTERRPRALSLLDQVGVSSQADKLPSSLSGGQAQRVAIARALANRPAVILADEPTGNLDSATAGSVLELLRGLANEGATVVIATHERDIGNLVDRKVEIVDGVVAR
ncbi:MAG: ABC transporter ATP-binding protein [Vicinamibacteria bacterium]